MELVTTLLGFIITSFVFISLNWAYNRHKKFQLFKRYNIPGPKPNFFFGNLYHLRNKPNSDENITAWLKKYGDVFGYYLGEIPYIVVKDLDILRKVFVKDFHVFVNRPWTYERADPLPDSIFGVRDKKWKEVRNIVSPMFTSGKLKHLINMVSTKTDFTVKLAMEKVKRGEYLEMSSISHALTLDVIGSAALALKMNCQEEKEHDILKAVDLIFHDLHNTALDINLSFSFTNGIFEYLIKFTEFGKQVKFILNHLESVMVERNANSDLRGSDFLQALIDSTNKSENDGPTLTPKEAVATAFGLFLAGYETTGTALAYTFYLLATHPDVQQRLYEEICSAKDSTYDTIQNLQYLDQVFNESLRLYPPVTGFTSRNTSQDYHAGSYTFPKDVEILAPVWDIHRDPDLWPNPSKFDPDRFSPENKGSIDSMAFIPFGVGPRNCVGSRMALLEAKTIIFKLLKNLKLEPCEKTEDNLILCSSGVITSPANGVWVKGSARSE